MITALFQKGPCSQYLMLHLAMCRPDGWALSASVDRHTDKIPRMGLVGTGHGLVHETHGGLSLAPVV